MEKISKELIGASFSMFILSMLQKGESYGFGIMQELKEISDGRITSNAATLYPVLKKLEKSKKIKSYWNVEDFGRPRRYYKLLTKGEKSLAQEKADWEMMYDVLNKLTKN